MHHGVPLKLFQKVAVVKLCSCATKISKKHRFKQDGDGGCECDTSNKPIEGNILYIEGFLLKSYALNTYSKSLTSDDIAVK